MTDLQLLLVPAKQKWRNVKLHTSHSQQVVGTRESYLHVLLPGKQTAKMAERWGNVS